MDRNKKTLNFRVLVLFLGAGTGAALTALTGQSQTINFSTPEKLAALPWSNGSNHGVSPKGPEGLIRDLKGRFVLETNLDFDVYASGGEYLQTLNPIDKSKNFYGFTGLEALPDGGIALLARLESPQEQWGKDNFQEQAKPGARLLVLKSDGNVRLDKELVDKDEPHSNYYLENGNIYSVHDDGTFQLLESVGSQKPKDTRFENFAAISYSLEKWWDHVQSLPVFHSGDRFYHDTKGITHEIKGATASLMGHTLVEGIGPLAERDGIIYYQVVLDKNQDFINAVFVEDTKRKLYGLVDLFRSDEELDMAHGHTVFVDPKGNVFEGVGKKDGYRIYEWKIIR